MTVDPATLWSERFAPRFAAAQAREEAWRAEAFVELPRVIAGEPIRLMTARDFHLLDGVGNALVCGTPPTLGDVAAFVWHLHAARSARGGLRDAWHHGRFLGRLRRHVRRGTFLPLVEALREHLDFLFLDAPLASGARESRPFGASFLVPLLGSCAAELGPRDPFAGRAWGDVPLPQLFVWRKLAAARAQGSDFVDRSPSDRIMSEFAAALNGAPAA